jgi:hypothetical protein
MCSHIIHASKIEVFRMYINRTKTEGVQSRVEQKRLFDKVNLTTDNCHRTKS